MEENAEQSNVEDLDVNRSYGRKDIWKSRDVELSQSIFRGDV